MFRMTSSRDWRQALKVSAVAGLGLFGLAADRTAADPELAMLDPADSQAPYVDLSAYRSVQERPAQDPGLAVAVAISGGGHRAANFAAGVFMGLEEIDIRTRAGQSNVMREIDYFSTVSGGGLAAGAYLGALHDHLLLGGDPRHFSFAQAFEGKAVEEDSQTDPRLRRHLKRSYRACFFEMLFSPILFTSADRGDLLEEKFDSRLLGATWRRHLMDECPGVASASETCRTRKHAASSLELGDLFVWSHERERSVRLPYWFPNATVFANGAIFSFVPDQLRYYGVVEYRHRMKKVSFESGQGLSSQTSYEDFLMDVPLSVALKASGSFPVAVPATTLKSSLSDDEPYIQLLDGGLSDNLGVVTAMRLLYDDPAPRKLLIIIDAYKQEHVPFSTDEDSPGLLATVDRTTDIALDSWRGRLDDMLNRLAVATDDGVPIQIVRLSFDDLEEAMQDSVREIETRFSIDEEDQELVIHAGRLAAAVKSDEIRASGGLTSRTSNNHGFSGGAFDDQ